MSASPDQLEQAFAIKIAKSIQTSPEDALLGFLDVDESAQQEVLQFLRNRPNFLSVSHYLNRYPALTCYGLAVAAPIGLQDDDVGGSAFYGGWQSAFGYSPPASERESLAHRFLECLDRLGLPHGTIFPDHELHIRGGCYLFHGAILPHFVEPLRAALESAQKTKPLPDPDDADRARTFAMYLAEKVHPAQQRLRKTLQSPVGSFLVRRLVRWLLTRDDSLFPAHIKPLLQEQKGRGVFLRSPYIQFDETEGQLQLVLPAQTSSVADSNTRWLVAGQQYRASSERPPIPLEDLGIEGTEFDVTLAHLKDERENITYHLQAGIPADRGFRIFDALTGKERKLGGAINHSIELTPGQIYLIVLDEAAEVKSDHAEEQAGDSRFIRIETTPVSEPMVVEHEGRIWTFKAKVRPGLYLSQVDDHVFRSVRSVEGTDVQVSYGSGPELTCAIPAKCETPATLHFSTRLDAGFNESVVCPSGSLREGFRVASAGELLTQWLAKLPPAVHAITVCLECDGSRMTQELFHWKGLQRITIYGDFYCENLPSNLGPIKGFRIHEQALIRPRTRGGKAELAFTGLGRLDSERWEVPANRVRITVVSADGAPTELEEGSEVEVLSKDNRVVQFRTGGLLPVRLTCNGVSLGEISPDKPLVSRFLSTIAAEHGRTGVLKAEAMIDIPGDRAWTVLNWRTPQTAKECRHELSDGTQVVWLIRKVSVSGLAGLRIKLYDFARLIAGEEAEGVVPLTIPAEAESNADVSLGKSFSCSVRRKPDNLAQVRVSFDREEMRGSVWVTELECLLSNSNIWQPVMSREGHGRLAVTRLVFIGGTPEAVEARSSPLADLFWGKPHEPLAATSAAWQLHGSQLARWLTGLQWLLACKYPTPVWHQNGNRFKSLCQRLSAVCLLQGEQERSMWWSHAITEIQNHACEAQPVILPCLLVSSSVKMAATSLMGCDLGALAVSGSIAKAFLEASLYENRADTHVLNYVSGAFHEKRIDRDLLCHFSGWAQLKANKPVQFGQFQYRDWSNQLTSKCNGRELSDDGSACELLSPSHFISCLFKAKRRADVLLSVSEQDYGHWLSGPISFLWGSRDRILTAITSILGPRLLGAPAEVLLRPLTESDQLAEDRHRKEFLGNIMVASCLVALAIRAKSAGIISMSQADTCLHSLIQITGNSPDSDEKLNAQIQLIIGTAPELFSFYFLLFTLSIPPVL
jgi:hypothetical protein